MPTAAIMQPAPVPGMSQHPTNMQQTLQQQQQQNQELQQQQQLRRAVYVHVSDLTSSYNIDNALLEEQLAKVKAMRDEKSKITTSAANMNNTTTSAALVGGNSSISCSDISGGGNSSISASGTFASPARAAGGVPTELDTSIISQKRLQPPRGGYNLCV
jgi:hypothetical protein